MNEKACEREEFACEGRPILESLIRLWGPVITSQMSFNQTVEDLQSAVTATLSRESGDGFWLYYRVAVATWGEAMEAIPNHVLPVVITLREQAQLQSWWWLFKQDIRGSAIRLRLFVPRESMSLVQQLFDQEMVSRGFGIAKLAYEPEIRLFGGRIGIHAAHDFFHTDSDFLSRWAAAALTPASTMLAPGLSVAILLRLLQAAGLDMFETWDFFERLASLRRVGTPGEEELSRYRSVVSTIRSQPNGAFLLDHEERAPLLDTFSKSIDSFGERVRRLYFDGQLDCGIREMLLPLALFHWNRAGFGLRMQRNLSYALAESYRESLGRSLSPLTTGSFLEHYVSPTSHGC